MLNTKYSFDLFASYFENECSDSICGTFVVTSNSFPDNSFILEQIMNEQIYGLNSSTIFKNIKKKSIEYTTITNLPYLKVNYKAGITLIFKVNNIKKI